MHFRNRADAARLLAIRLFHHRGRQALVLGVPPGGVPVARTVADALEGELDLALATPLHVPARPDLAIGAVEEDGTVVRECYLDVSGERDVRAGIRAELDRLRRRRLRYAGHAVPIDRRGRLVIIVDDGTASGATLLAAIRAVRARRPQRVVLALAVSPLLLLDRVGAEADEVVCLHATPDAEGVGACFDDLPDVTDAMVGEALAGRFAPLTVGRQAVGHDRGAWP